MGDSNSIKHCLKTLRLYLCYPLIGTVFGVTLIMLPASAQIPCYPQFDSEYYTFSFPTQYPPLVTSMPLDVLVGHIGLDSLCKAKTYGEIETFFRARTYWDDTLKYAAKYLLSLVDYDPVLLRLTQGGSPSYMSLVNVYRDYLVASARGLSARPELDEAILGSDYILVINVTSVTDRSDTSAAFAQHARIVRFNVVDTILGKTLPGCYNLGGTGASVPPDCNWFDISREQVGIQLENYGLPADSGSVIAALPMPTKQYLVFLRLSTLCQNSTSAYMTMMPLYPISAKSGVFEVTSGSISDPMNLFGVGNSPTLSSAVEAIRTRILTLHSLVN
ncbi:MAG: hypothetical protein D8M52_08070 [Chlorobi bacterium]|nr:hypothetical protein [Chlorobiota bacterium]NOG68123.1 hypothetical protein [Chlorobiota bacterium]